LRPVNQKEVQECLYAALGMAGIPDTERRQRNITFHSWRHFFNSWMRGKVPDAKLRRLTGHRTEEMTEHYTHFKREDYNDVAKIQEDLFGEKNDEQFKS
jgi:integrase